MEYASIILRRLELRNVYPNNNTKIALKEKGFQTMTAMKKKAHQSEAFLRQKSK